MDNLQELIDQLNRVYLIIAAQSEILGTCTSCHPPNESRANQARMIIKINTTKVEQLNQQIREQLTPLIDDKDLTHYHLKQAV